MNEGTAQACAPAAEAAVAVRSARGVREQRSRRRLIVSLLYGQLLSVLVTVTSTSSTELARDDVDAPTLQSTLVYAVLGLGHGAVLWRRGAALPPARRLAKYAAWALVDVEANYLVVTAFQYTSLASVTLLDMFTIPCALLLTRVFLQARYTPRHVGGVLLCVAGIVGLVASDAEDGSDADNEVLGDMLALCGAALMAASNVTQELIVRAEEATAGRSETLAFLGVFGAAWSALQVAVLEREQAAQLATLSSARDVGLMLAFVAAMLAFYSLGPVVLERDGSAFFNLSLLTSDVWAVVVQATVFGQLVGIGYAGAALVVCLGIVLYSSAGEPRQRVPDTTSGLEFAYSPGAHGCDVEAQGAPHSPRATEETLETTTLLAVAEAPSDARDAR